jgi:hypothetical protein
MGAYYPWSYTCQYRKTGNKKIIYASGKYGTRKDLPAELVTRCVDSALLSFGGCTRVDGIGEGVHGHGRFSAGEDILLTRSRKDLKRGIGRRPRRTSKKWLINPSN